MMFVISITDSHGQCQRKMRINTGNCAPNLRRDMRYAICCHSVTMLVTVKDQSVKSVFSSLFSPLMVHLYLNRLN